MMKLSYWVSLLFVLWCGLLPAFLFSSPRAAVEFPGDHFVAGWHREGQERQFTRNGLYGHINGGSELFLEFGFEILKLQKYRSGSNGISIETYRMESPGAALAIYLMKCGTETPVPGISSRTRNTGDYQQIMMLKGSYFITINNFSRASSLLPVMVRFANGIQENLPAAEPANLFSLLPPGNRVKGSELLIRGQYSLQAVYTLGEGDILLLKNKIFGVTAQYTDRYNGNYNMIIVRYPDEAYARKAFSHLRENLDAYIQILETRKNSLTFTDYQKKFGRVSLKKDTLLVTVNLSKKNFPRENR